MRATHTNAIPELFKQAMEHHAGGRLDDALHSYDAILRSDGNVVAAHYNRGFVLLALRRLDDALESFDRAVALAPDFAEAHLNRGNILKELDRPDEALQCYDRAITLKPGVPEAHYNRGNVLQALDRPQEALQSFNRAIGLKRDFAEAYNSRGLALKDLKRPNDALQNFSAAIALKPDLTEAHVCRGSILRNLKRFAEAVESYDRAIRLNPDDAAVHRNRGNALRNARRPDEALQSFDRAIALKPHFAEAYSDRGNALGDLGRMEDALQSLDKAIAQQPDLAEAHSNRGNLLKGLKRLDEALQGFDEAIALKPDFAEAYWNKSLCALAMGNLEDGWRLYEWRKTKADPVAFRDYPQPAWSGEENIAGKTLFIYAEQGLGDTIQFCRYATRAEAGGARVILAVQESLMRLLRALGPGIEIVALHTASAAFDTHVALLSMPRAFRTGPDSIPARVPYLRAEPAKVSDWRDRIGEHGFKVGICWQGNKGVVADSGRSFAVRHLEAIARLPGIRVISLQKNDGLEQLQDLPAGMTVETLDGFDAGPDAFIDAAAVMESLDLVITADTVIAHLAGALGRPVWVALQHVPDWRWLLDRSDSPWYPTMKLFRQTKRGDWSGVFLAMEAELAGGRGTGYV
jgi:tetratricopeptide (TPR) repeat protein